VRWPGPKWLLLAPPCVWGIVGLTALVAPGELIRLFPLFWPLHDVSLMLAATGLMLWFFKGPGPVGPVIDEWSVPAQAPAESEESLEVLLKRLASALETEARSLTSTSRR
jgi:hypothetical protein